MPKREIAKRVAFDADVPVTLANDIVQRVLNGIIEAVGRDGGIELRGFGVFKARMTKERMARNPRTGEKFIARPRARVSFAAGKEMEERLAGIRESAAETVSIE